MEDKIKKSIDSFEEDDFVSSKEELRNVVVKKRDAFLKDKLELKGKEEENDKKDEEEDEEEE
jgi:hypothetical protein